MTQEDFNLFMACLDAMYLSFDANLKLVAQPRADIMQKKYPHLAKQWAKDFGLGYLISEETKASLNPVRKEDDKKRVG